MTNYHRDGRVSPRSVLEAPASTIRRAQLNVAHAVTREIISHQDAVTIIQALGLDTPRAIEEGAPQHARPLLTPRALL